MSTPESPNPISALDVKIEFSCPTDFLSMRQAVFGDSNTPISMSMFWGQSAIPDPIIYGNSGFEIAGWTSSVQGNSPYRRPSNSELGILFDPDPSDPGLWAVRNIPVNDGFYIADIRMEFNLWRKDCSKYVKYEFITNGTVVKSGSIKTAEGTWQPYDLTFTGVLVNSTTQIRLSSVNRLSSGEIGFKDSTITITANEKATALTNYLSVATVPTTDTAVYNNPISGTYTVSRNTNTVTNRSVEVNGNHYAITGSTLTAGSSGTFTFTNWNSDNVGWTFTPTDDAGLYEILFTVGDDEGRTATTSGMELYWGLSYGNAGWEYAGWTTNVGNTPKSGGYLVDNSGGGFTFSASRDIGFGNGRDYLCNIAMTGQWYRDNASGDFIIRIYTDGVVQASNSFGIGEESWTSVARNFSNVKVNDSSFINIQLRNGHGSGKIGYRNATISVTPLDIVGVDDNFLSVVADTSNYSLDYPDQLNGTLVIGRNTNSILSRKVVVNGDEFTINGATVVAGAHGTVNFVDWTADNTNWSFIPDGGEGIYSFDFIYTDNEAREANAGGLTVSYSIPPTLVLDRDDFGGTNSFGAVIDAEDDLLVIGDSSYNHSAGTSALFLFWNKGGSWEQCTNLNGDPVLISIETVQTTNGRFTNPDGRLGTTERSVSVSRLSDGSYLIAVGNEWAFTTSDGTSNYSRGVAHAVICTINAGVVTGMTVKELIPTVSTVYHYGVGVTATHNGRVVVISEYSDSLGTVRNAEVETWDVMPATPVRLSRVSGIDNDISSSGYANANYVDSTESTLIFGSHRAIDPSQNIDSPIALGSGAVYGLSVNAASPALTPIMDVGDYNGSGGKPMSGKGHRIAYDPISGHLIFSVSDGRYVHKTDINGDNAEIAVISSDSSKRYLELLSTGGILISPETVDVNNYDHVSTYNVPAYTYNGGVDLDRIVGRGSKARSIVHNKKRFKQGVENDDNGYLFISASGAVGVWKYDRATGKFV